ncbi:MAG TPA: hypothetical protein EYN91_23815 [Candidatus Melainabacteria bacterium]|nr:hypothetical protein [Candidatus Melainabacteria bacterium]HIN64252.1 hypothetical protein [Candidatus Obscuribacterales bacterium]
MRWKYIKIALIGAVLGFFGQLLCDLFLPGMDFITNRMSNQPRSVIAQYWQLRSDSMARAGDRSFFMKAEPIVAQGVALCWMARRSGIAFRTAVITSLLLVAIAQGLDYIKRDRKSKRS